MGTKTSLTPNQGKSAKAQNKNSWLVPALELAAFAVIFVFIFLWLYQTIYKTPYSATGIFFNFASQIMDGHLPYKDFNFEYPPVSLVFFLIPRLFAANWQTFSNYYQIEVLVAALIGLLLVYAIAYRLGKAPWKLMAVYTVAILAIGPITGQQYDIFPAILMLAAVYFFWTGKHKTSWTLLALGTLTKLYPAVLAPVFIMYYLRNRQYRELRAGLITFAVICLGIFLPFLIMSPGSLWNLISYHGDRGLQLESTYSAFLLLADKLGLTSVSILFNYGSWNIVSPLADALAKVSTYLLGISLLAAYWFIYRQIKPGKSQFTRLGAYSLLLVSLVLVFSKVFSPQYLIWLVPVIPLILNRWRVTIWVLFVALGVLTYYIFPLNYLQLLTANPNIVIVVILFLRDILIILLTIIAVISLRQMKPSD